MIVKPVFRHGMKFYRIDQRWRVTHVSLCSVCGGRILWVTDATTMRQASVDFEPFNPEDESALSALHQSHGRCWAHAMQAKGVDHPRNRRVTPLAERLKKKLKGT